MSGKSVCKQQVGNGRNAAAARKCANKDDPLVKKKGIVLPQSVWNSIRGSLQKFGVSNPSNYFDLFMELPAMHAKIHRLEMHQSLLGYDDDYAITWFQSDAGKRWELPPACNLSHDRHDRHCPKYKRTKEMCCVKQSDTSNNVNDTLQ